MLHDRPSMRVEKNDPLYLQAERVFSQGVSWKNEVPENGSPSCFSVEDGSIKLQEGMSFEESWSAFFFESFNRQNSQQFEKVLEKGSSLSREEWVRQNAHLEYEASQNFLAFSDTVLLPYFRTHSLDTLLLEDLHRNFSQDFENWMKAPEESYPWNYWGKFYDENFSK